MCDWLSLGDYFKYFDGFYILWWQFYHHAVEQCPVQYEIRKFSQTWVTSTVFALGSESTNAVRTLGAIHILPWCLELIGVKFGHGQTLDQIDEENYISISVF